MVGSFAVGVVADLEEASGSSGVIDFLVALLHVLVAVHRHDRAVSGWEEHRSNDGFVSL